MSTSSLLCGSNDENDSNILESYMSDEDIKPAAHILEESVDIYMIHCRLCANIFSKVEAIAIFEGDKSIADKISQCLPVIIIPQDNFPKYICETCSGQLELCCDLILKSIESERFFKQQMEDEIKKQEAERKALSDFEKNEDMKNYMARTLNPDGPVICDLCGNKKFSNMETFDSHMVSLHNAPQLGHPELVFNEDGRPQYECPACHEHLDSEPLLRAHEQTHTDLICKSCQQFHSNAQKLQRHICPDSTPMMCSCNQCGRSFDISIDLKMHIQEAHKDDVDGYLEEDRSAMVSPITILPDNGEDIEEDTARDKFKYECKKCYRRFMNAGNLARHLTTHEEQVVCDICDRKYTSYSAMLKHRRQHGGTSSVDNCHLCSKVFYKHSQLVRHLEKEHNIPRSESSPWCCRFCNKRMMTKLSLAIHERIHTGHRPYVCSWCGTAFRSKANLLQHHPVHTGARTHACGVCGKAFSRKSFVTTHMRVHTGDRPYGCDICDAKFTQVGDMRRHKKIHTGTDYLNKSKGKEKSHKKVILTELDNAEKPVSVIEVHIANENQDLNCEDSELMES